MTIQVSLAGLSAQGRGTRITSPRAKPSVQIAAVGMTRDHARACALVFLVGTCATSEAPPTSARITRLDESTIDTAALTRQIDTLTRAANVHGLTVTIFNDAAPVYTRAFGFADQPAGKLLRTDTEIYGEGHGDGFQHYSISIRRRGWACC